jgi:hypothetical protein
MSTTAVIMVRIKRIIAHLRACNATTPAQAVLTDEVPYSGRWYFRRLVARGVIHVVEDHCYLDSAAADHYLRTRRLLLLAVALVILVVAGLIALLAK